MIHACTPDAVTSFTIGLVPNTWVKSMVIIKHSPVKYTFLSFVSPMLKVKDQFKTWTVSKPSDGFKTGRTALSTGRRLKNGPRRLWNRPRRLIALAWFELISRLQVDTCSEKASNYACSDHWQAGRMSSGAERRAHKHAHEGAARDGVLRAGRCGRHLLCTFGAPKSWKDGDRV